MEEFFVGIHQISDLHYFERAFVSVNRLRPRKSKPFTVKRWIMDSGAFTEIFNHGDFRYGVDEYAAQIDKWKGNGNLLAAVSQDYMCEPFILEKVKRTVIEHQEMTVARYDELLRYDTGVYIMPVLQGYAPSEYMRHLQMYGDRLAQGAWVGVGSVCKRNADPLAIHRVLAAIKYHRPDLQLHGFGLKMTAISSKHVRQLLHTSDSMAWSYHARMHGRNGNSWEEAMRMVERVEGIMKGDN